MRTVFVQLKPAADKGDEDMGDLQDTGSTTE